MASAATTIAPEGDRTPAPPTTTSNPPRRRIDRFELAVLALFAAVSVWVLALDLWHAANGSGVWTGSDSLYGVDQFQYLAWIRDSSHHFLVSNLFVMQSTPSDYFQPAIVISGGLTALGLSPTLALLLWKPIAVAAVFYTVRGYIHRTLADRPARRAALVLALFFGSFTVVYGAVGAIGDLFPGFLSWGYPFGLLGLAAMLAGLLSYERARARNAISLWPGVLGAVASVLHPWNGVLLVAAALGGELLMLRRRPAVAQLRLPVLTAAITVFPLCYYVLLGRLDLSWRLARAASKHTYPLWAISLELVPLLAPALLAYRRRPREFLNAAGMVWPVAAFVLFMVSTTRFAATPVHAFQGITVPLAVLAVQGVRGVGFRRLPHALVWGSLLIAVFTVPATLWEMNAARRAVRPRVGDSNLITRDENDALRYLARDRRPGGVIARQYLGQLVPGATGRHTFVGDCLWSQPDCSERLYTVHQLFSGELSRPAARQLIESQHAAFLLADCRQKIDLEKLLPGVIVGVHRFGCATVYDLD